MKQKRWKVKKEKYEKCHAQKLNTRKEQLIKKNTHDMHGSKVKQFEEEERKIWGLSCTEMN